MKNKMFVLAMLISVSAFAEDGAWKKQESSGLFSLGTRNTFSMFNDDSAVGKGIGGQFRIQFSDRINTEWYFDYITSKDRSYTFRNDYHIGWSVVYYPGKNLRFETFSDRINTEWYFDYITSKDRSYTFRNDYHIGWSVVYYPGKNLRFETLLQPYLIAGHCFDYSVVSEQANKDNSANRLSMATQAGMGTHINITKQFDCSLSAQYMLHFGKEIETNVTNEAVTIETEKFSSADGHLLLTLSFNYKFGKLW